MGTARAPFKSRTLEKSLSPLLVLPGERKSIPSPLTALFSKFHPCRRHFLYRILYSIRESHLTYVRFSNNFFVTEVPRATKLRRIVQKACRYTLISKNPFRLSVPKVRFLLATLTYIVPVWSLAWVACLQAECAVSNCSNAASLVGYQHCCFDNGLQSLI